MVVDAPGRLVQYSAMKIKAASILLPLTLLACTPTATKPPNRAAVVMKLSDSEAHVCMGVGEVKPGDRVTLYGNDCTKAAAMAGKAPAWSACVKRKLGEGTVARIINEHYSVVQVDPGVVFKEGTTVEKRP